jgi:hypothetical protein
VSARPLPDGLLDARAVMRKLGVTRAAAERIMRRLPLVTPEELRKVYVRADDLAEYLDRCTTEPGEMRRR